jgi:uncharacterized protein YbbC (DUF1343 family)
MNYKSVKFFLLVKSAILLLTCAVSGQTDRAVQPAANNMSLYLPLIKGKSVAIFANQTTVAGPSHLVDTLLKKGVRIKKIFAPEHGFRGIADAGEDVGSMTDPKTGVPIVSLYGNKQAPDAGDLKDIDIMIFDIQDVGVRFYTYISSLQEYMEAAIENDKPLIILDRPDPNGFYVDGPVLDPAFKSFVGMQPVPVVYGMTIGEYAVMLLREGWLAKKPKYTFVNIDLKYDKRIPMQSQFPPQGFMLTIIRCPGYTHKSRYALPVKPSPNLPNMQSIYLYPSICFFEGTEISLGRGTDKPFQQFGSPSFSSGLYSFTPRSVEGAKNPPLLNKTCYGYDLSKLDAVKEIDGRLQLKWLIKAYELYPDKNHFFLSTNYFSTLAGTGELMQQIKNGKTEEEIRKSWKPALSAFKKIRKKYLLYPDFE